MANYTITWLLRRKWLVATVAVPILVALWWAFRPEKLWINQKVNEAAPFAASADPQPVLTGQFDGKAQQVSGRATIYKRPGGGAYLRLSDFTAANAADVHVVLAPVDDSKPAQDGVDLGPLKSNQGDQNYDLPAATDLKRYPSVVIYEAQPHTLLGVAKLEAF